jgi:crotonobetainyl-CoA:carnitine CoA-transferase CaiB-like acyl-CoA transferase
MDHPHVAARGMALQPRDAQTPPMIANPMLFDGQRPVAELSPPVLDAHQARWLHVSP